MTINMAPSFPINVPDDSPFTLQNLPYGIFSTKAGCKPRVATVVGNSIVDLSVLEEYGLFAKLALSRSLGGAFGESTLNIFAKFPRHDRQVVREKIMQLLSQKGSPLFSDTSLREKAFFSLDAAQLHLPFAITDYTDFFSSKVHAINGCRSMKIDIPPAFYEYPMAYNGRISSIKVSGADVIRPSGFYKAKGDDRTKYQPSQWLDFEIEMGVFVSTPIEAGQAVTAKEAGEHIFGYVLLNDWSARDVQGHEMFPFGPFHGKSFLTSISPWVVVPEALSGSLCHPPESATDSSVDITLVNSADGHGVYDIAFSASLSRNNSPAVEIAKTYMKHVRWSHPQMIAYQSSSGCGLNTGDLLGSGTMSSPMANGQELTSSYTGPTSFGCLSEVHSCGHTLPQADGRAVTWLEDGDNLTFEGWFQTPDGKKAGFGGVTGLIVPPEIV